MGGLRRGFGWAARNLAIWSRPSFCVPLLRDLQQLPDALRGGAVAIGNFDGVHAGHRQIVARLLARAKEVAGASVVLTFDPHPAELLRPERRPPSLTWLERKDQLLEALGVDWVIAYPTDRALLELSAREFYDRIIRGQLDALALVEGPNFFFGKNREGDVERLARWAREDGLTLEVVSPVERGDGLVSSSRIRDELRRGNVASASSMLCTPYRIRGQVAHGAGRGGTIGFPTANLSDVDTLIPGFGVYAGRGYVGERSAAAAIHIGPNPTFDDLAPKVEVHLLDWSEDLYDRVLEVEFFDRIRGVETFASPEALIAQLGRDVSTARRLVESR
ncbi:MAG: bifunctional riboflavin kinase/FAD synthetase [Planctomycetales bacterium]|nr:bifunctional riboflavin kinase/FAD synthetase [Planctomycetales bacterium]